MENKENNCNCSLPPQTDINCSDYESPLRLQNEQNVNVILIDEKGDEIPMNKDLYKCDLVDGKLRITNTDKQFVTADHFSNDHYNKQE